MIDVDNFNITPEELNTLGYSAVKYSTKNGKTSCKKLKNSTLLEFLSTISSNIENNGGFEVVKDLNKGVVRIILYRVCYSVFNENNEYVDPFNDSNLVENIYCLERPMTTQEVVERILETNYLLTNSFIG